MPYITPAEFEDQMKALVKTGDTEVAHEKADELMCKILKAHGYESGVKIFEEMERWYA